MSLHRKLFCLVPALLGCWSLKPGHELPDAGTRDAVAEVNVSDGSTDAPHDAGVDAPDVVTDVPRVDAPDVVSDVIRLDAPDVVSDVIRLDAPDVVSDVIRLDAPDVVSDVVRLDAPDVVRLDAPDVGLVVAHDATDVPVVVPTGLRLVWPPGLSTVTHERPTLRWSEDVSGVDVVLCRHRDCDAGAVYRAEVVGKTHTPPAGALAPGVWYWSLRRRDNQQSLGPTWQFRVPGGQHRRLDGAFGVSHRDMNNDGHWDIAVGAPGPRNSINTGAVHVHLGGPNLSATPSLTPTSNVIGFGWDLVWGDFNGDLRADLAVAAFDSGLEGQARIGSVQVLRSGGSSFLTPEVIRCARCVTGDFFATRVAAGDLNGDGYDDLFVSSPGPRSYVHVHYGGNFGLGSTHDALLTSPNPYRTAFGTAIAVVGDLDGDGYGDLVVSDICDPGATMDAPAVCTPSARGRLNVYFGGASTGPMGGAPVIIEGGPHGRLGREVVAAGDLNGDGFADFFASGSSGTSLRDTGVVHVFLGRRRELFTGSIVPSATVLTPTGSRDFGHAIAGVDVEGDGFGDLVAGAPGLESPSVVNRGQAYESRQSPDGGSALLPSASPPLGVSANFGTRVASVGDVNGDGRGDLVVTAPSNVTDFAPTGNAYVWFGGPGSFPSAAPDLTLTGANNAWLGRSLAP